MGILDFIASFPNKGKVIISIGIFFICIGITISLILRGSVTFNTKAKPKNHPKIEEVRTTDELGIGSDTEIGKKEYNDKENSE